MSILAVVGLKREAHIVGGAEVRPIIGGGDAGALARRLSEAITPETRGIMSFGIAGALSASLDVGDLVIGARVIGSGGEYDADIRWTGALPRKLPLATPVVAVAGSDTMIASREDKIAFRAQAPAAWAVDMESHIVARIATEHRVPFAVVRVVSDTSRQSLPDAARVAMQPDGGISYGRVLLSILKRPQQIPDLIRTGQDSDKAFEALLRCRDMLGPGLGCPYLA